LCPTSHEEKNTRTHDVHFFFFLSFYEAECYYDVKMAASTADAEAAKKLEELKCLSLTEGMESRPQANTDRLLVLVQNGEEEKPQNGDAAAEEESGDEEETGAGGEGGMFGPISLYTSHGHC
jgi:hypothetical protein